MGRIARALPSLRELRLSRCRGLALTCLVEIGLCAQLEWLGVSECQLALASASGAPLARLTKLHSLDLGGNQISAEAAVALCEQLRRDAKAVAAAAAVAVAAAGAAAAGAAAAAAAAAAAQDLAAAAAALRLWGSPLDDRVATAAGGSGLRLLDLAGATWAARGCSLWPSAWARASPSSRSRTAAGCGAASWRRASPPCRSSLASS